MHGKRGQELSTKSIVLIILGVFILVFLIIGFTLGWKKILPWLKKDSNIDDVVSSCRLACKVEQKNAYCSQQREIILDKETAGDLILLEEFKASCSQLSAAGVFREKLGTEECSSIVCPEVKCVDGLGQGRGGRAEICSDVSKCPNNEYWKLVSGGIWKDSDMKKMPGDPVCCRVSCLP